MDTSSNILNPSSSSKLVEDTIKKAEHEKAAWYQTAQTMHRVGLLFIALSLALAITTAVLGFDATPLSNENLIIMGSASFVPFVLGVVLVTKTYWNDPLIRKEKIDNYVEACKKHGYAYAKKHHGDTLAKGLISIADIKELIKDLDAELILGSRTEIMVDGIFKEQSEFDPYIYKLLSKPEQQMTFKEFFNKYKDFGLTRLETILQAKECEQLKAQLAQNLRDEAGMPDNLSPYIAKNYEGYKDRIFKLFSFTS